MDRREFLTAIAAAIGSAAAIDIDQAIERSPQRGHEYDYGFYVIEPGLTAIADNPPTAIFARYAPRAPNRIIVEAARVLKMPRTFVVERVGIMPTGNTIEGILDLLHNSRMQIELNGMRLFSDSIELSRFPLITQAGACIMPVLSVLRIEPGHEIKFIIERDAPAIAADQKRPPVNLYLIGRHLPA